MLTAVTFAQLAECDSQRNLDVRLSSLTCLAYSQGNQIAPATCPLCHPSVVDGDDSKDPDIDRKLFVKAKHRETVVRQS